MTFNTMNYTAYLASSEIIEADDFQTIFRATQRRVRDDAMVAIILRNNDHKVIALLAHYFGQYKVLRPAETHPNMLGFLKAHFVQQDNGWMWQAAGLE